MKNRILVVEDEDKLRRVIELQLQSAGYEVDKAGTAEEALRLADRADLVLTDLRLPGMDGLELLSPAAPPGRASSGGGDDGLRHRRERGRGHEGGRHRFPAEAVLARSPDGGDRQGAGVPRPARREPRAARGTRPALRVRQHRGAQPGHAGDLRHHHARGAHARHGAAGRRERRRQGPDRPRHSLPFAAPRPALRQDQLHGHPGKPDGERTVRLRERAPSPAPAPRSRASSSRPTPARCSWTRSATSPAPSR